MRTKRTNLYWYRLPKGETNFGDELGPFIIERLSGEKPRYIPIVNRWYKVPIIYILGLLKGRYSINDLPHIIHSVFAKKVVISVGSIISSYNKPGCIVWGAGLLDSSQSIYDADFRAVRGKFTKNKIVDLGYKEPLAIGDPALLLPLIVKPSNKKFKIGIIPHYIHYEKIIQAFENNNVNDNDILIINLKNDIEMIIQNITSCEQTFSSSLHGLIVSHAYGKPSMWCNFCPDIPLAGDNVKFKDYFSSVNIEYYDPIIIDIDKFIKESEKININDFISIEKAIVNKMKIREIQEKLLDTAPFKIM